MEETIPKILLIGNDGSGLDPSRGAGACIARTKRFRRALEDAGFQVDVCSPGSRLESKSDIRECLNRSSYSCAVAISPHPAEFAILAGTSFPLWIDMNGMHPAEVHLSGDLSGEPRLEMLRILSLENTLLSRGDHYSAPSSRQAHAIMGELYLLGRLGPSAKNVVPVSPIPHCALEAPLSAGATDTSQGFSIISTGSFNSWFDGDTLFDGLEYAMRRNDRITFTSTGGSVPFADDQYREFEKRSSGSEFRSRITLAGWVSEEELDRIQNEAGAAVYTDIACGETLLGARTRALDWISRGIPVVCTAGAEISETVVSKGMGIAVPQGDPVSLGEAFLKLAAEPETVRSIREAQEVWRRGDGSMTTIFQPLIQWCREPEQLSRDKLCPPTVSTVSSLRYRLTVLREISRRLGYSRAAGFLLQSIVAKLTRRSG